MSKPLPTPNLFASLAPPWSLASLDGNTNNLFNAVNDVGTYANTLTDSGAVNALVATTPVGVTFSLVTGIAVDIIVGTTTTSTVPTLNVNSSGAKVIVDPSGNALSGNLIGGGIYRFVYDGTSWRVTGANFGGNASSAASASISTVETYVTPALPMGKASTLVVGNAYLITLIGKCTSTHSGDTTTINTRIGTTGSTSDTACGSLALTSVTGASSNGWIARIFVVTRAIGVSGSVNVDIELLNTNSVGINGNTVVINPQGTTTINTTQTLLLGCSILTNAATTAHVIDHALVQRQA